MSAGRYSGAGVGMITAYAFFIGIAALILVMIAKDMPIIAGLFDRIACASGLVDAHASCVQETIAAAKAAREEAEAKRRDAEDARQAALTTKAEFETILATQAFHFEEGQTFSVGGRFTVVVGTMYRDAKAKTGVLQSFCWLTMDRSGLDPRIGVAMRRADGVEESLAVEPKDLAAHGIDPGVIPDARAACPWPRGGGT